MDALSDLEEELHTLVTTTERLRLRRRRVAFVNECGTVVGAVAAAEEGERAPMVATPSTLIAPTTTTVSSSSLRAGTPTGVGDLAGAVGPPTGLQQRATWWKERLRWATRVLGEDERRLAQLVASDPRCKDRFLAFSSANRVCGEEAKGASAAAAACVLPRPPAHGPAPPSVEAHTAWAGCSATVHTAAMRRLDMEELDREQAALEAVEAVVSASLEEGASAVARLQRVMDNVCESIAGLEGDGSPLPAAVNALAHTARLLGRQCEDRCVDADSILHTLEDRVLSAEAALAEATRHQFQLQIQAAEDSIQRELQEVDSALQLKLMQAQRAVTTNVHSVVAELIERERENCSVVSQRRAHLQSVLDRTRAAVRTAGSAKVPGQDLRTPLWTNIQETPRGVPPGSMSISDAIDFICDTAEAGGDVVTEKLLEACRRWDRAVAAAVTREREEAKRVSASRGSLLSARGGTLSPARGSSSISGSSFPGVGPGPISVGNAPAPPALGNPHGPTPPSGRASVSPGPKARPMGGTRPGAGSGSGAGTRSSLGAHAVVGAAAAARGLSPTRIAVVAVHDRVGAHGASVQGGVADSTGARTSGRDRGRLTTSASLAATASPISAVPEDRSRGGGRRRAAAGSGGGGRGGGKGSLAPSRLASTAPTASSSGAVRVGAPASAQEMAQMLTFFASPSVARLAASSRVGRGGHGAR